MHRWFKQEYDTTKFELKKKFPAVRWKGDWRWPKEGIRRPTGGYYRIPGLGGFDNGEKWKDSRVLYILKLEEPGNLTMEGEKRDSAS